MVVGALGLAACDKEVGLSWNVAVSPELNATTVRVRATIEPGTCDLPTAAPLYAAEDLRSASVPDRLPEGQYAFRAQAVSSACAVVGEGCVDVALEGGDVNPPELDILVRGRAGRVLCAESECSGGNCIRLDAGVGADAMVLLDAGSCVENPEPVCVAEDTLRTCRDDGTPQFADCSVGCAEGRCLTLLPRLLGFDQCESLPSTDVIIADDFSLASACQNVALANGADTVCALFGRRIQVQSPIRLVGEVPVALIGNIVEINADLDLAGHSQSAAPAGMVDVGSAGVAGGAGHATPGGEAGPESGEGPFAGGPAYGGCPMDMFTGGSQTGGNAQGGGALYIVGCDRVDVRATINAGGEGAPRAGFGGGSGGTLFIEGGEVNLFPNAILAAAGGAGAAGASAGENGRTDGVAATGSTDGTSTGGAGGVDDSVPPAAVSGGSGGGAAGYIRVESHRGVRHGQLHGAICEPMGIASGAT